MGSSNVTFRRKGNILEGSFTPACNRVTRQQCTQTQGETPRIAGVSSGWLATPHQESGPAEWDLKKNNPSMNVCILGAQAGTKSQNTLPDLFFVKCV